MPASGPGRRKSCFFCKTHVDEVDYKNVNELRRYVSERGKIRSRRISGACRRHQRQQRKGRPAPGGPIRKRNCYFCREKIEEVDYKSVNQLRRYISEKGKIRNRRITGACRRHQRQVAVAVKRAREMALLPYVEPK